MAGKASIFLDPTGRRARLTNRALAAMFAVAAALLVGLVTALSLTPRLPEFSSATPEEVVKITPDANDNVKLSLRYGAARNRVLPPNAMAAKRMAFLDTTWPGAMTSLRTNASKLDVVIPDWIRLTLEGRPSLNGVTDISEVRPWLAREAPDLQIIPRVDLVARGRRPPSFLADEARRRATATSLAALAVDKKFHGLVIPLWTMPASLNAAYSEFVRDLARALKQTGRQLIVQIDGAVASPLTVQIAKDADFIIVDLSRNFASQARGGAPAAQGWFETALTSILAKVDPRKVIVSVGTYAYNFADSGASETLSMQQAWDRMSDASAFRFDAATLNGRYSYTDNNGTSHTVWLLDAAANYNQMRTALAQGVAGVALWKLGLEEPDVWSFAARGQLPADAAISHLQEAAPGFNSQNTAKGSAFSISFRITSGVRELQFDPTRGLILDETMRKLPSGAVVQSWGEARDNRVVLTFDDGPDPRYTPQILDILKEKKAPAAFFIIGRNALQHPELIQRMFNEGHEIGNHTFSHPNLKDRTQADVAFELNSTQRVLESQIGVRTVLFRAPYADMGNDGDQRAFSMMDQVSRMGYVSIRVTVDPRDWANPTPAQIASRALARLEHVGPNEGQIVLLHDAGGSRRSTIAALPVLIDALRERGFRLVPVSEIIGKSRQEVMPHSGEGITAERALSAVTGSGLGLLSWLSIWVPGLAVGAAVLGVVRLSFIIALALRHRKSERERSGLKWRPPSLTVLVPAYNEEAVVCKTIRSLLASRNRKFDIVVIDDGSSDNTADAVRREFWKTQRVRVFKKQNGGKSAALNFGLRQTEAEIVIALDADTVFAPDSIEKLIRHFKDPRVGAVAGRAVVGNEVSLMARFQSLEYVTSQNLDRRAFEGFNAIGVVPGAIGAWRRQPLIDVGGFPLDTLAEDADATIAMERAGWRVLYEPAAIALTEAPETVRAFMKQRFRWMYGTLQVAFKHRDALVQKTARGVGYVTIPNIVIFQFAFTLLAPLMDLMLLLSLIFEGREWMISSTGEISDSLQKIALYWLLFQGVDSLLAAVGLALNGDRRRWNLFPLIFIQRFCYRQLLYFVAIKTLLAAVRGQFVGWGKLLRTGNVQETVPMSALPA